MTTTTKLDEFDVPSAKARRATTTARPAARPATRVVERKRTAKRVRVASLAGGAPVARAPSTSLTGGGIAWRASSGCLAGNLRSVVASLSVNHGPLTVNSTCRSAGHNRRVGGARKSWHLTGNAVDFRIRGANIGRVYAYLRSTVGGLKHYGGGRFHIDNGPRRTF